MSNILDLAEETSLDHFQCINFPFRGRTPELTAIVQLTLDKSLKECSHGDFVTGREGAQHPCGLTSGFSDHLLDVFFEGSIVGHDDTKILLK